MVTNNGNIIRLVSRNLAGKITFTYPDTVLDTRSTTRMIYYYIAIVRLRAVEYTQEGIHLAYYHPTGMIE